MNIPNISYIHKIHAFDYAIDFISLVVVVISSNLNTHRGEAICCLVIYIEPHLLDRCVVAFFPRYFPLPFFFSFLQLRAEPSLCVLYVFSFI